MKSDIQGIRMNMETADSYFLRQPIENRHSEREYRNRLILGIQLDDVRQN